MVADGDQAGLKNRNVLLKFDGKEITDFKQFRQLSYNKKVGDEVHSTYLRVRKEKETTRALK